MQLIVLGMHRSGTSTVTRLLNLAGAYFGTDEDATETNQENPKGFWERRDVRNVCDGLLHDAGFDWWRTADFDAAALPAEVVDRGRAAFADVVAELDPHLPWVIKEPRLCLLLPVLLPELATPICIHVHREPVEVAHSVQRRNGFPLGVGASLWEQYTIASLRASAGLPHLHLRYDQIMADPHGQLDGLIEWLSTQGVTGLSRPDRATIDEFIDPALHRNRSAAEGRDGLLNTQQRELAHAVDTDTLDSFTTSLPVVSDGALDTLRAQEVTEDLRDELLSERRHSAAVADEARRLRDRVDATVSNLEISESGLGAVERSRAWHLAQDAVSLRQRVDPRLTRPPSGPIERIRSRTGDDIDRLAAVSKSLADIGSEATRIEQLPSGLTIRHAGEAAPSGDRPTLAVISWDVGHNPLGRAYIMAEMLSRTFDVEIWGAQFPRYGKQIWPPLRGAKIPIHFFDGADFPGHQTAMTEVAGLIEADLIWVSKPRLPSLGLGALAKLARNRPLVLDVDDHELSFFDAEAGLSLDDVAHLGADELVLPFERAWTLACDPLIGEADLVTVSNPTLAARYGGMLVPHARDETTFDPARYDRSVVRRQLGVDSDTRLLLFGGTARAHKGVLDILDALDRLGDERYRLALFATRELDELRDSIGDRARWIVPVPPRRFADLAPLVHAADLSCVLQDPTHPVSAYQLPAKITDALAMGVPCLVNPVPPIQHLIDADLLEVTNPGEALHDRIARVFDEPQATRERTERGRAHFLAELSYEAVANRIEPVFRDLIADPPAPSAALDALIRAPLGVRPPVVTTTRSRTPAHRPGSRRWDAAEGEQYDLVVFWKQNDSGIYGRRQDMFLEYLKRSGRFANIVHFDNPISPERLAQAFRESTGAADQRRRIVRQTVERLAHRRDEPGLIRRTFLHRGRRSGRLRLPRRADYPTYVEKVLAREGIGERLTVFWVYPTNNDFAAIADSLRPDLVVADVVDDNRTWYQPDEPQYEEASTNYAELLCRSDLVLANCDPVAEAMSSFAPEVHVIPNGCEVPDPAHDPPRPSDLPQGRPVIGYVGNLSDRIDIDLLEAIAVERPDWAIVLVGSAHRDQSVLRLDAHPNIHFLGVRPYAEVKDIIRHFDVALIPHVDNEMTRSMNPLKAFVYVAAGAPVVSTPIANLGELAEVITIAEGADGFIEAIETHLVHGRQPVDRDLLARHSWETRIDAAIQLLDAAAGVATPPG